jgi:hypothetical protein
MPVPTISELEYAYDDPALFEFWGNPEHAHHDYALDPSMIMMPDSAAFSDNAEPGEYWPWCTLSLLTIAQ